MLISRRNTALTVALAVVATAAVPAAADIATSIQGFQYDQNTLAFDGTLSSPNKHCLGDRKVTITRTDGATPTPVGTATTDSKGFFSLPSPQPASGTYTFQATVAKSKPKGTPPPSHKSKGKKPQPVKNCGAASAQDQEQF